MLKIVEKFNEQPKNDSSLNSAVDIPTQVFE